MVLGYYSLPDSLSISSSTCASSSETSAIPLGLAQFAPKAKRIIYLFQNGAPSQLETFDYKPLLTKMHGEELPESIRKGQRLTGMTSNQESFPLVGSTFNFSQYGQSGAWVSELFPNMASIVDEMCIIKSRNGYFYSSYFSETNKGII